MAYKALYRTYRPQNFDEVIGQETIVRALQNAIRSKKTTHAYLFSGPRGTGKTTIARILAKALNCESLQDANPCCECVSCREIGEGINPNVIEIDAASNNGVDEIREIREKAKFLPAGSKYKVYIIDEVHMLSTSAFNALLKILEEPPKHVVFILATTEQHKVLPTILSRCQRYDFKPFTQEDIEKTIARACENENIQITEAALHAISSASEGGMRDAYSILDQAIALSEGNINEEDVFNVTGALGPKKVLELVKALENKDISSSLNIVNDLLDYGKEVNKIVISLLDFYKGLLIYKNIGKDGLNNRDLYKSEYFEEASSLVEQKKIFFYVDILSDLQNKIRFSTTPQIYLEVAIIKIINVSSGDIDFSNRLSKLEQEIIDVKNGGFVSGSEASLNAGELEKIGLLDDKIDNVIEQLNKMELPKWIVKVQDFEASSPNLFIKKINELMNEISKVQEDVALLKVTQDGFQNTLENSGSMDASSAISKINELEDLVKKAKPTVNYSEIESFVNRKLDYLEEERIKELEKFEKKVFDEVTNSNNNQPVETETKISQELEERLKVLEENSYKLMSGAFKNANGKKVKPALTNENQLALFGDELVPPVEEEIIVSEELIENIPQEVVNSDTNLETAEPEAVTDEVQEEAADTYEKVEEKVEETIEEINQEEAVETEESVEEIEEDLEDLDVPQEETEEAEERVQEESSEEREPEEIYDVNVDFEELSKEDSPLTVQQLNPFDNNEEKEPKEVKARKREKVDPNADLFAMYSDTLKEKDDVQEKPKASPYEKRELSPAEKALNASVASLSRKSTVNSELVYGERKTNEIYFSPYNSPRQILPDEKVKAEPVPTNDGTQTDYNGYDVKILERILNDSRTEEARNDKARIANLWRYLPTLAPSDKRVIAEVLAEGVVCAVGKNEFVISYPSISICNQVMSKKFKQDSLRLLYDMLDSEYNYLALSDEIWHQKRTEYVNQYNIGIKYPKLSPFNNPELVIKDEEEVVSEGDMMLEKAKMLFGDSLQTIKKEDE